MRCAGDNVDVIVGNCTLGIYKGRPIVDVSGHVIGSGGAVDLATTTIVETTKLRLILEGPPLETTEEDLVENVYLLV